MDEASPPPADSAVAAKMCGSKRRYAFEHHALTAAWLIGVKLDDPRLDAYPCPICDWWHIGHKKRGNGRTKVSKALQDGTISFSKD